MGDANVVAHMEVCGQDDVQLIQIPGFFVHLDFIGGYPDDLCIDHSVNPCAQNEEGSDETEKKFGYPGVKLFLIHMLVVEQDQAQGICKKHHQGGIEIEAKPVVSDQGHHAFGHSLRQKRACGDGKPQGKTDRNNENPQPFPVKKGMAGCSHLMRRWQIYIWKIR